MSPLQSPLKSMSSLQSLLQFMSLLQNQFWSMSSLHWQLQSKRPLQSPPKSRVRASAAEPPKGMACTSAPLWAVAFTPELSACPVMAKEAVLELSICPVTAKEALPKVSVCPFKAKEAIPELSYCPVMAAEAAVNLCALYYTLVWAIFVVSCTFSSTEVVIFSIVAIFIPICWVLFSGLSSAGVSCFALPCVVLFIIIIIIKSFTWIIFYKVLVCLQWQHGDRHSGSCMADGPHVFLPTKMSIVTVLTIVKKNLN